MKVQTAGFLPLSALTGMSGWTLHPAWLWLQLPLPGLSSKYSVTGTGFLSYPRLSQKF